MSETLGHGAATIHSRMITMALRQAFAIEFEGDINVHAFRDAAAQLSPLEGKLRRGTIMGSTIIDVDMICAFTPPSNTPQFGKLEQEPNRVIGMWLTNEDGPVLHTDDVEDGLINPKSLFLGRHYLMLQADSVHVLSEQRVRLVHPGSPNIDGGIPELMRSGNEPISESDRGLYHPSLEEVADVLGALSTRTLNATEILLGAAYRART